MNGRTLYSSVVGMLLWTASAQAGFSDLSGSFGVGTIAVNSRLMCHVLLDRASSYDDPGCCYQDSNDPTKDYCQLPEPIPPADPKPRPPGCEASWGGQVLCFSPSEQCEDSNGAEVDCNSGSAVTHELSAGSRQSPPAWFDGGPWDPLDDDKRVKSLAIMFGDSAFQEGDGSEFDKRKVVALRGDGVVFASDGAVGAPDRDYAFGPWQEFVEPLTTEGNPVKIVQISKVQPRDFGEFLYGVSDDHKLFVLDTDQHRWFPTSADGSLDYAAFVGGAYGALGIAGTTTSSKDLRLVWRDTGRFPPGPEAIPPVPSNRTLVNADNNFIDYFNIQTLTFSLGVHDAWFIYGYNSENFLMHSTAASPTWTDWVEFPTGPWSGFDEQFDAPYSVVDAWQFRHGLEPGQRGIRGELFMMGNGVHVLHYVPDVSLDGVAPLGSGQWSAVNAQQQLSLVVDPATSTSGQSSLMIDTKGAIEIASPPFVADAESGRVAFDVLLPQWSPLPPTNGTIDVYLDVPLSDIYAEYVGRVELDGLPLGTWQTVWVDIPQDLRDAMQHQSPHLRARLVVETDAVLGGGVHLDRMLFLSSDDGTGTSDNCPDVYNPGQEDFDGDGIGDACDPNSLIANAGPDQTKQCVAAGKAFATLDGSASSAPSGSLSYSWGSSVSLQGGNQAITSGNFPVGTTLVSLVVSQTGISDDDSASVTVVDTVGPSLVAPPDVVATTCSSVSLGQATATDTCGGSVTIFNDAPASFKAGLTIVTWGARDQYGNLAAPKAQRVFVGLGDSSACCPSGSNIIVGTSNNDVLTGTAGADCIIGKGGQDTLKGLGGNDILSGGDGDDTLEGGDGSDSLHGGTGQDRLNGQGGSDNLSGGDGDDQCWGGVGNDVLQGALGQDKLYGEDGDDELSGNDGNDRLEGAAGNDKLDGGSGSGDVCMGGSGTNTLLACEAQQ